MPAVANEALSIITGVGIPLLKKLTVCLLYTSGSKVTLDADGLRVTATTESGVASIVALEGTAEGESVRVRFG